MRKLNWATIILDLIMIVLGAIFIISPSGVESVLCYILAAAVAVIGLVNLAGYFIQKADEETGRRGNGFVLGILLICLGIFIVVRQELVIALVPFLFGVMVMIRGLMVIQGSFYMRRMGFGIGIPLATGLLTMALGLFIMLFPFETAEVLFILIGCSLLAGGITGIIQEFMVWSAARKLAHEIERAKDMEGAQVVREEELRKIPEPETQAAQETEGSDLKNDKAIRTEL